MQILSRLLPLGLSLVVSFSALAENSLPVPAYTGLNEGLTKHVTSLREARFDSVIEQKTDYSCGAAALAAHSISMQLASLSFMVPLGLAQAATVRVGCTSSTMKRCASGQRRRTSSRLRSAATTMS